MDVLMGIFGGSAAAPNGIRLELLTGAKPLGRQRGAGRESLLKERQGKRVTEDLVMPLAAKYSNKSRRTASD